MAERWIAPDRLFDGRDVLTDMAFRVEGHVVTDIAPAPPDAIRRAGLVTPGFVDVQVNGGGGVLFNTQPTPEGVKTIAAAHRQFGTVAIMPTVITDHPDVLDRAAEAVMAVQDRCILGVHIEGPHISDARRGTHAPEFLRPMDDRTMDVVQRLRRAQIRVMITVTPENTTNAQITALAGMGAVVSLGHTDATAAQIEAALTAGATCGTHLFNAMSPMQSRVPGAVGAIINADCYAGIICDGHHVADQMVGLAIRARPVPDRMMLVSDAMPTLGGPESFDLYGREVAVKDGRLVNEDGVLSGAHTCQAWGVQRLVEKTGTSLTEALRMAISTPAKCMGVPEVGQLLGRSIEDLIVVDDDLNVTGTLTV